MIDRVPPVHTVGFVTHGVRVSLIVISVIGVALASPRMVRVSVLQRIRRIFRVSVDQLHRHEAAARTIIFVLGLIPALYFGSWVHRYGVAVPKNDDWDVAMLISQAHAGRLSFADLFVQQQEGRTILPRLIFIASTLRGCWDVRDLMWLTLLTCVLSAAGIFHLLRKSGLSLLGLALTFWASTLLIFSPTQFEVITFAFGFPSFLPVFFIISALVFNTTGAPLRAKFLVSALAAIASSFTLPHGLLAWGLTFPVLLVQRRVARWPRWLFAWSIACAICAAVYFWGYRKPADLPEFAPQIPWLDYLAFFVAFLGNGMQFVTKAHLANAEIFGTCTLAIFAAASLYVVRRRTDEALCRKTAPWVGLGFYSLGSAGLATLGRIGFGLPTALSSRYVPFSLYLTISAFVLIAVIGRQLLARNGSIVFRNAAAACGVICFTLGLTLHARCAADGIYFLRARAAKDRIGRAALTFSEIMDTKAVIKGTLYPPGAGPVMEIAPVLDSQKLLRPALLREAQIQSFDHHAEKVSAADGEWESTEPNGRAIGWAALPKNNRPADAVVLAYSETPGHWTAVALSNSVAARTDIARRFAGKHQRYNMEQLWTGWTADIPLTGIPPGAKLTAWAVDTDGPKFYQLENKGASQLP